MNVITIVTQGPLQRGGKLGFFDSPNLPISSLPDSLFFLYGLEYKFFLETNYRPNILDISVEKE